MVKSEMVLKDSCIKILGPQLVVPFWKAVEPSGHRICKRKWVTGGGSGSLVGWHHFLTSLSAS